MDDELLPIGAFARSSGLTIDTLRHYDAQGVLRPAHVDPHTGYRRYRHSQVDEARTVAALRDLDLPLGAIRELLTGDPAARDAMLRRHRARLEARAFRLTLALHHLRTMAAVTDGSRGPTSLPPAPMAAPSVADAPSVQGTGQKIHVPTPPAAPELDPATHRALGVGLYNRTWELLEVEDRTPAQDDELAHTAHASAFHWAKASEGAERARGEWLCSRVYAVMGRGAEALHHARRCLEILDDGPPGIEDWDRAAASEAMARAHAVAGDAAGAAEWRAQAEIAIAAIADLEDRTVIVQDLETLPT